MAKIIPKKKTIKIMNEMRKCVKRARASSQTNTHIHTQNYTEAQN